MGIHKEKGRYRQKNGYAHGKGEIRVEGMGGVGKPVDRRTNLGARLTARDKAGGHLPLRSCVFGSPIAAVMRCLTTHYTVPLHHCMHQPEGKGHLHAMQYRPDDDHELILQFGIDPVSCS